MSVKQVYRCDYAFPSPNGLVKGVGFVRSASKQAAENYFREMMKAPQIAILGYAGKAVEMTLTINLSSEAEAIAFRKGKRDWREN